MADWPSADEIKQVLDIASSDWDDTVDRIRLAAIYKVQHDVGAWDEYEDEPDESLAQAALRMAELISLRPAAATETSKDPAYLNLMFGHHKRFAIS